MEVAGVQRSLFIGFTDYSCDYDQHVLHVQHLQRTDVTFDDVCNIMDGNRKYKEANCQNETESDIPVFKGSTFKPKSSTTDIGN